MSSEEMITGYQWGDFGQYIGPYTFPNNKDKVKVHMPPRTTLSKPPSAKIDEEVAWDGTAWYVRRQQMDFQPDRDPSIPDYTEFAVRIDTSTPKELENGN